MGCWSWKLSPKSAEHQRERLAPSRAPRLLEPPLDDVTGYASETAAYQPWWLVAVDTVDNVW